MKKLILLILLFSLGKAYAQRNSDYSNDQPNSNTGKRTTVYDSRTHTYSTSTSGKVNVTEDNSDQIRLIDTAQEIRADILPYKSDPKIKNDRYYFWYLNKVIHSTQGGFSGQLLNGHYVSYYPDKNLKEEGDFKRGLKDGTWKTWNQKGDLTAVVTWNDGVVESDNQQSIFKKIPFLSKKDAQPQDQKPADNQ
jgi:antitoxin component YwqK of YwqJK toxin-antitoxin module